MRRYRVELVCESGDGEPEEPVLRTSGDVARTLRPFFDKADLHRATKAKTTCGASFTVESSRPTRTSRCNSRRYATLPSGAVGRSPPNTSITESAVRRRNDRRSIG